MVPTQLLMKQLSVKYLKVKAVIHRSSHASVGNQLIVTWQSRVSRQSRVCRGSISNTQQLGTKQETDGYKA